MTALWAAPVGTARRARLARAAEAAGLRRGASGPHTGGRGAPERDVDLVSTEETAARRWADRLDAAAALRRRAPAVAGAVTGAVGLGALLAGPLLGPLPAATVVLLGLAAAVVTHRADRGRRTVRVTVDRSDLGAAARHGRLLTAWASLCRTPSRGEPAVWRVGARGAHHPVLRGDDGPRHLRADVAIPTLAGRRCDVAFTPDGVVVREGRRHRLTPWSALGVGVVVRERADGGRVARLTLETGGGAVDHDLTDVDGALRLADALRGMAPGDGRAAAVADRGPLVTVPGPRVADPGGAGGGQASVATGRSWASPTEAL